MKINKYPDGSSYVEGSPEHHREHVFKINSYEDLWHLNQWIDNYVNVTDGLIPTIVIPNLIDAQADRRFAHNQSSGLKLVCKFLNSMKAKFKIFHPHNPEVVEALMDNVEILDNFFFIKSVLAQIENKDNLILMSSDAGGFKPLMKLCDKINWKGETISASKSRSYNPVTNKSELVQLLNIKDLQGKDVLIVDDICVYGGTFKGLSKLLKSRNCGNLYLAVSHMTVQNLGEDPVTDYFDMVFTTNSKYDKYICNLRKEHDASGESLLYDIPENLKIIELF
jgi:phosphoribosylpyrophosphate synthetase